MEDNRDARLNFLLDSFLETHDNDADTVQTGSAASNDYASSYLNSESNESVSAHKAICSRAEELLNAFLSGGNEKIRLDPKQYPDNTDTEADESQDSQDLPVCTENMAYIYLKQRRYDKALAIIRSLYLNFPNKSIYFADQIRYLELLIRINKNK